jgi:hypothetical protein
MSTVVHTPLENGPTVPVAEAAGCGALVHVIALSTQEESLTPQIV